MAGMYDSVSLQGILDTVGDNPVAHWMQKQFPNATAYDPRKELAGAVVNARTAAGADDDVQPQQLQTGAIPAPASPDQSTTPDTDKVLSLGRGALNAQDAGTQAIQDHQKQTGEAAQTVADAKQKGGDIVPDAKEDPVGHLAQRNQNNAVGVGDATGTINPDVPRAPSKADSDNALLDATGKQSAGEMNKITWWKSSSFNQGLMAFGLNLLSGKSLAESFAVGSQIFDQHYGAEQRESWRSDLEKKGYDPLEIQRYVETGDNKVLTSPAQKRQQLLEQTQKNQMSQIQLTNALQNQQLGAINLRTAQIENTPEAIEQRQSNAQYDRILNNKLKLAQIGSMSEGAEIRRQNQEIQLKINEQKLAALTQSEHPEQMLNLGPNQRVVINQKTKQPQWNAARNRVLVQDTQTGETRSVPIDPTTADAAAQSAQATMNYIKDFRNEGLSYFGMGGEAAKNFKNFFTGGRTQADWESRISELNNSMHNAAVDKLIYESPNKPNMAEVETKAKSLGELKPGMSQERAKQIMDRWDTFLSTSLSIADSQRSGSHEQLERHNIAQTPPVGFTLPDGRVFQGGNPDDGRNWK